MGAHPRPLVCPYETCLDAWCSHDHRRDPEHSLRGQHHRRRARGRRTVPASERHGTPLQLLWTWASPNLEFATIFVGIISVLFFVLSFPVAVLAVVLGNAAGAVTHGILSAWGPSAGVPQMIISRSAFGFWGNILPAGLNSVMAGIGCSR